jgi:hypothetical protein
MSLGLVFVCTAFIELYVLRRLRFDWLVVGLVVSGTLLSVDYLTYTAMGERNYDAAAHLEYIQTLAQLGRPPEVFACVACGHPPLYYALGAIWSKLTLVVGFMPLELRLQWLSLLLSFGFVATALLIFRSCRAGPTTLRLATALLVFWPSGIINSVRVHNDALASPLLLAAMYLIAQWDQKGRERDFYAALAMCALSLLTKATGYTVAATLLFFVVLRLRASGSPRAAARAVAVIAVLVAVELLAVGLRESPRPTTLCQKVFGHACDGRHVPVVADTPSRFFSFDVRHFVGNVDALHGSSMAHDYFLNRLLKSSLFGVAPLGDDFAGGRYAGLASVISVLLLVMVAGCLVALPFLRDVSWRIYRVYIVTGAVMFASLVAFRIAMPNEYHEDFRHIFPVLVPCCLGYAKIVSRLGRLSQRLRQGGVCIALLMVAASIGFFARLP